MDGRVDAYLPHPQLPFLGMQMLTFSQWLHDLDEVIHSWGIMETELNPWLAWLWNLRKATLCLVTPPGSSNQRPGNIE